MSNGLAGRRSVTRVSLGVCALIVGLVTCAPNGPVDADHRSARAPATAWERAVAAKIASASTPGPRTSSFARVVPTAKPSSLAAEASAKASKSSPKKASAKVTVVRGGYVHDPGCSVPTGFSPVGPTTFALECWGHEALYTGGLTGHTLVHLVATFDANGNFQGTYDNWFYGRYMGDGTFGMLHFQGIFGVKESQEFFAEATIVGGNCGFAGSSGSFTADGNPFTGGFTVHWIRPKTPPPPDPTCNPLDEESIPPIG